MVVRNWPFTILGLVTLGIVALVERSGGRPPEVVAILLRVLVIPQYVMGLFEAWFGMGKLPEALQLWIGVPLLLLPYVTADLARHYWRHLMEK